MKITYSKNSSPGIRLALSRLIASSWRSFHNRISMPWNQNSYTLLTESFGLQVKWTCSILSFNQAIFETILMNNVFSSHLPSTDPGVRYEVGVMVYDPRIRYVYVHPAVASRSSFDSNAEWFSYVDVFYETEDVPRQDRTWFNVFMGQLIH